MRGHFRYSASCHKPPDDAADLLHKVYSEQQGLHLVVWQSWLSAPPRSFSCLQSYTEHETLGKIDWLHPVTYKASLIRHRLLLDDDK